MNGDQKPNQSLEPTADRQDFSGEFTKRLRAEDAAAGHSVFQAHLRRFIVDTFRERHTFCHELASRVRPKAGKILTSIKVFRVFIELIEEHVNELQNEIQNRTSA
jgi:hypothetical protein